LVFLPSLSRSPDIRDTNGRTAYILLNHTTLAAICHFSHGENVEKTQGINEKSKFPASPAAHAPPFLMQKT
jgi:hypothetical protein